VSETIWQSKEQRIRSERDEAIKILYRLEREVAGMGKGDPIVYLEPALAQVRAFLRRAGT
jgi:hypothetical protein